MTFFSFRRLKFRRTIPTAIVCLLPAICVPTLHAQSGSAYVRVNQAGYEAGSPIRVYLMSTVAESGATFQVTGGGGVTRYSGSIGVLLGTWSNSKTLTYNVYALDFTVPALDTSTRLLSQVLLSPLRPPLQ